MFVEIALIFGLCVFFTKVLAKVRSKVQRITLDFRRKKIEELKLIEAREKMEFINFELIPLIKNVNNELLLKKVTISDIQEEFDLAVQRIKACCQFRLNELSINYRELYHSQLSTSALREFLNYHSYIEKEVHKWFSRERARLQKIKTNEIDRITGTEFENVIANLFRSKGYSANVVGGANDFGVDVVVKKNGAVIYAIQCKRKSPQYKVASKTVQILDGALNLREYVGAKGLIITNVHLTASAKERVRLSEGRIGYWNREKTLNEINRHNQSTDKVHIKANKLLKDLDFISRTPMKLEFSKILLADLYERLGESGLSKAQSRVAII